LNPGEEAKVTIETLEDAQDLIAKHTKEISEMTHTTIVFGAVEGTQQKVGDHEISLRIN
jgi:hypothetical protein